MVTAKVRGHKVRWNIAAANRYDAV